MDCAAVTCQTRGPFSTQTAQLPAWRSHTNICTHSPGLCGPAGSVCKDAVVRKRLPGWFLQIEGLLLLFLSCLSPSACGRCFIWSEPKGLFVFRNEHVSMWQWKIDGYIQSLQPAWSVTARRWRFVLSLLVSFLVEFACSSSALSGRSYFPPFSKDRREKANLHLCMVWLQPASFIACTWSTNFGLLCPFSLLKFHIQTVVCLTSNWEHNLYNFNSKLTLI